MIEITCTKTEKKKIIKGLQRINLPCIFPRKARTCRLKPCRQCIEEGIKWNIQGGQHDRSTKTSPQRNPLEDEDRTRADGNELAGTSVKECGRAVPA